MRHRWTSVPLCIWALSGCADPAASGQDTDPSSGDGSAPTTEDSDDDPSSSSGGSTSSTTGSTTTGDEPDSEGAGSSSGGPPDDAGAPRYDDVMVSSVDALPVLGDPADLYVPVADATTFPVALMLQGANVDKQHYSAFATLVARYGFIVVIPNHESTGLTGTGLFMEQGVIVDALAGIDALAAEPDSDVYDRVDSTAAGLLGHSYGGVVGVYALTGQCTFPFCEAPFELPEAVTAGVFFGTNMRPPLGGSIAPLNNGGLGIGLLQGTADSKAKPADAVETFQQVQTPPAALVTLLGANHYGLTDVNNPDGADADASVPTMPQDVSIETSGRFAALMLRAWVLDDGDAAAYLASQPDPNVTIALTP